MRHIPFKRHLIILVPCIVLIGIMVPFATFAKSTGQTAATTVSSDPRLIVIHNDANCPTNPPPTNAGSGSQVLYKATQRVEVDVTAQMYSADFPEQEGLFLSDSKGRFAPKTIDRSTSTAAGSTTIHFEFTAPEGDVLSACFKQLTADNEGNQEFSAPFPIDHPAAVLLKISDAD